MEPAGRMFKVHMKEAGKDRQELENPGTKNAPSK
jgi:hypothetical protein